MDTAAIRQSSGSTSSTDYELETRARAELLQILFKHSPIVFLSNLAASITLVVGLSPVVPAGRLTAWFVVMSLFNVARSIGAYRNIARSLDRADVHRQEVLFLSTAFVSGLLWGSAAVFFYLPNDPANSMFLALVLIAMGAASAALLSFHRFAFPFFVLPTVVPLAAQLLTDDQIAHLALGIVIPVYFTLLFVLSRQIYRFVWDATRNRLIHEHHALIDPLTAIPNRRAFEEFLNREWRRATRTETPISLIIADIDDFKRCNDMLGHPGGDKVLRSVAMLFLNAGRRGGDLAARIGGEEFAIVATETDQYGALTIARNIQQALETTAQRVLGLPRLPTMSFGICSVVPKDSENAYKLFEDADAALYKSKAGGKNSITTCTGMGEKA